MDTKKIERLDLVNLFEYLHPIAEKLQSIVRWEARENIAGQSVRENDLQHTFKTIFMTATLTLEENKLRTKKNQLDFGMLLIMAMVHDCGEPFFNGDTAHFIKMLHNRMEDIGELEAFRRMAAPLPETAKNYFIEAMMQTMPGSKDEFINTKEARFFIAVENLMFLKRGLYECGQGNLHFAPKCLDWSIAVLRKHAKEFPSLKAWYQPYIKTATKYLREYEKQREKYVAEFIKRGGRKENFPF
ncbi:MAG: YfbR-like 5'-deoxynucleotidase [Candidatus Nealsonbacteria bacterium]